MTTAKKRYKLHDLDIRRVDLVDRGAAQDAHIVLTKADTGLADRLDEFIKARQSSSSAPPTRQPPKPVVPGAKPPARPLSPDSLPNPLLRDPSKGSRLIRISPADFEVVRSDGNMMEWAIPEDQLPEGVEEAMMTMVRSGDDTRFQWMIDPIAGPPIEGNAKTAAEAFMAMRGALTNQTSLNPLDMLGGLPTAPGQPGAPKPMMPKPVAKHSGPGPHPSGSDQSSHGGGGGGRRGFTGGSTPEAGMGSVNPISSYVANERDRRAKAKDERKDTNRSIQEFEGRDDPEARAARERFERQDRLRRRNNPNAFAKPSKVNQDRSNDVGERYEKRTPGIARALRALARAKKNNKRRMAEGKAPIVEGKPVSPSSLSKADIENQVLDTLELVTKGLVEVGVFADDATGEDLRDILPPNLLDDIRKLSATESAE